jgi:hypothetical protein
MRRSTILTVACLCWLGAFALGQDAAQEKPKVPAKGNPVRLAKKTGHTSNYDEAKVKPYTLPELLKMADGEPVTTAEMWFKKRRPEILKLFQTEIFGRVPENAPKVKWDVVSTDDKAANGTAILKKIVGTMSDKDGAPKINLSLFIPAKASGPVPVILVIGFGKGGTLGPVGGQVLAKGFAYASFNYTDVQPDQDNKLDKGVIGLTLRPGQTKPDPDEWGGISAWAWAVSRCIDYFETDKAIDAKCIGIQGTSRLGRTALWAAAQDERVTAAFPAVSGEAAAALARRDWGETVDDMAQNYAWQLGGNYQKWVGRWNDMPVDSHMLIALVAPRALFVNGGTTDQWMDPVGMFLGLVHAGPAYKLVGAKDLGVKDLPPVDKIVMDGDLAWSYHTGGHMATPNEWTAFLDFAGRHFKNAR